MFKRAISDLERLLGEALSLASQVADQSEVAANTHEDRLHSLSNELRRSSSLSEQSMHSAQESVNLSIADMDDAPCPRRPGYQHSASYTYSSKRPRLADIVKSYSGAYQNIRTRMLGDRPPPIEILELSAENSPSRRSSRVLEAEQSQERAATEVNVTSTSIFMSLINANRNIQGPEPSQKRAATAVSASRNATGQDVVAGHDATNRKVHGEHGISLRRRSHVSLRNMKGFSLPKSYKRQPIARD